MTSDVIGAWFPSGYHGHYRTKSRADVINEFRQKAKPAPPEIFHRRFREIRLKNPFTSHDNKSSLILDAMGFGQGVGKKKVETRCSSRYNPDFFAWAGERGLDQGYTSVNQTSYTGGSPVPNRKVYVSATNTPENGENQSQLNSTYRLSYGHQQPWRPSKYNYTPVATPQVKPLELPPMTARPVNPKSGEPPVLKMRTKSAPPKSSTVHDCLIWFDMVKPRASAKNSISSLAEGSEVTTTVVPLPATGIETE